MWEVTRLDWHDWGSYRIPKMPDFLFNVYIHHYSYFPHLTEQVRLQYWLQWMRKSGGWVWHSTPDFPSRFDCCLNTNSKCFPFLNDFQRLLCTNTPRFTIEHISVSVTGHRVFLWGPKGASVMHLPRRYGKFGQYENGKEQINCR